MAPRVFKQCQQSCNARQKPKRIKTVGLVRPWMLVMVLHAMIEYMCVGGLLRVEDDLYYASLSHVS